MAMLVTKLPRPLAALGWMAVEWIVHGRPSVLGIVSGAVAGLVAVTPAAGTAGPGGHWCLVLLPASSASSAPRV